MSDNNMLPDGVKFKGLEKDSFRYLPEKTYAVIRFDGKNFSTFTKRFEKPYDLNFMGVMDEVTRKMAATIPGAIAGYTQSDEISIVFSDLAGENSQMWFGGRVDKMLSIGAATVTALFMQALKFDGVGQIPVFDARVHTLADVDEVDEYVRWRRFDAQKNAVTMAANVLHSHKSLMSVSSKDRLRLLEGTPYEKLPEGFFNGRVAFKETFEQDAAQAVPAGVRRPADAPTTVTRSRWVSKDATRAYMEQDFLKLF
jgi:tRNA(His) guanylyltransferase